MAVEGGRLNNSTKLSNLTHSTDQRTGTTHFEYDKLGRITKAGSERFAFDPAHNILSDNNSPTVPDNRLKTYNGTTYYYDNFGNLIHRELVDGEVQNYFYDLHDQLVKAEIFKKDGSKETWSYTYDALGRRIGKGRLKNEEVSGSLEEETRFVWDGSHLLQEIQPDGRYTYIYTDPSSYEPLAQVHNRTNEDGESRQQTHYFHCDQIGIPREMTDGEGNLLWFGEYYGWGKLKSETKVTDSAYQPFRLQNQYADRETGLHYNFFRYYEPDAGRFVNQDPIGLMGGENFYQFAPNTQSWIDPSGNIAFIPILIAMGVGALSGAATDAGMQVASNVINGKEWNDIDYGSVALGAGIGAITGPVLGKAAKLCVGKCQAKNFFKGTRYTEKVKKQASSGDYHSFPEAVDSFSRYGKVSKIKGGDGITRQKLEIPGGYKGKEGIFEYIKEPNGNINHRLFKPNK